MSTEKPADPIAADDAWKGGKLETSDLEKIREITDGFMRSKAEMAQMQAQVDAAREQATKENRPLVAVDLNGPTLRDRFAMAALTGLGTWCPMESVWNERLVAKAEFAYAVADAMLAARKKGAADA